MPKSFVSFQGQDEADSFYPHPATAPSSPETLRRTNTSLSASELRARLPASLVMTPRSAEDSALLEGDRRSIRKYTENVPESPNSRQLSRVNSTSGSLRRRRGYYSSRPSGNASPVWMRNSGLRTPKLSSSMLAGSLSKDDRLWYDQFTSTDWVHDSIADGYRVLELKKRKGWRGRLGLLLDSAQGWVLVALIGVATAGIAYFVDVTESAIFDIKRGFCRGAWYLGRTNCCAGERNCDRWRTWSELIHPSGMDDVHFNYLAFIIGCVTLAALSFFITLYSKTIVPSQIASTFDENLGALQQNVNNGADEDKSGGAQQPPAQDQPPPNVYYSAAGSGVAEVKVILSGFVLHGYLGLRVLVLKTIALILSVASGMSLGKEGPYVHIATCVGNIACRLFAKYNLNDGKRREVLSASAAAGVAVAFGSPLGGVLFSLEEVSYYFPPKTLFRTFFCCIVAALSLKFLNPYGTSKIVLFEVRYTTDWRFFELLIFILLGVAGGLAGALFIKASRFWATTFRRIKVIKSYPMLEVLLVALVTGLISFWNRYTRLAVNELLFELASPCQKQSATGLCPNTEDEILRVIGYLSVAFVIKAFLTIITFGIKVPAGIYVPSMVVGGLMGRIVGHLTQYVVVKLPNFFLWSHCRDSGNIEACVTPGVYALVAAGATMCGVTRLSVTLAVILFELTGSLDHVLPFCLGVLCAKWTADAVEPLSIYDLLTDMNSYPFLDNRRTPVFDSELGDITPRFRRDKVIDITISPLVKASDLRAKLRRLQNLGELDGGLPIIRDKKLVGLIPAPDLEFALDRVEDEDNAFCLLSTEDHAHNTHRRYWEAFEEAGYDSGRDDSDDQDSPATNPTDLTSYIDPAPVALDMHSPMDLVYQCFVKLGLRYICVLNEGEFRGMVHKKAFVRYIKTLEHEGSRR
ncbi:chloride channel, other eukaryote [Cladophialophora psammophila CBS 110553]|uniref:Chloride channel, other eukaryote n=1 Tax=Cladophialophora psammophila CBS 110553 TaxID=1182543 RepID=W9XFW6_9EURO|nr:chloride channel, other eukaryote [Cladophialophora psammophila CBS 110553]EXJ69279.1 chloride channel, other eukaryote [Cladophialophora psammophila CBS 110553]